MNAVSIERRAAPRHRVFKHGTLAFHDGSSVECTVRNISTSGARVDAALPIGLPSAFTLVIEKDHFVRPCHAVWNHDHQVGIAFD